MNSYTSIFGPPHRWNASQWKSQTDALRGGASTAWLQVSPNGNSALFEGTVDSAVLGGAGFSSVVNDGEWNFEGNDGLWVEVQGVKSVYSPPPLPYDLLSLKGETDQKK